VQNRRLVLVRHAEAADAAVDADRPLTASGARRAAAIGDWLLEHAPAPERVLVSPARRTVQTWARAGGAPPVLEPRIYEATVEELLAVVRETPDEVQQLAVVGHNPSISELAAVLDDGHGDAAARRGFRFGFPTGGVAVFTLGTPFAATAPGAARLQAFAVPGADPVG